MAEELKSVEVMESTNTDTSDKKEGMPIWKDRRFWIGVSIAIVIIVVLTTLFTLNATKDNNKAQAFKNAPRKNVYSVIYPQLV
jgi:hypothetical protein